MGDDPIRDLIAGALLKANEDDLRGIVTELVRQLLESHDLTAIFNAALTPVVKQVVDDLLTDPEVSDTLARRVRAELLGRVGGATLDLPRGRY